MASLLAERGYEAVTFEEVARRAGASKPTLYRRWRSKRDMVVAALKAGPARRDDPDDIDTGSLRGDLLALCQRLNRTLCSTDGQTALLLLQAGIDDRELGEEIERSAGPTGARLPTSVVTAAIRRGELPDGVDPFPFEEVAGAVLLVRRLTGLDTGNAYLAALVDSVLVPALRATSATPAEVLPGIFSGRPHSRIHDDQRRTPMTTPTIDGFHYQTLRGDDDVELNVAVGGIGPAIVLLHGFPQTHYMWHEVAPELADEHTVIVPDLRGYGASGKPTEDGPHTYSKRTMANDIVRVAQRSATNASG